MLETVYLENPVQDWLLAAGLALVILAAALAVRRFLKTRDVTPETVPEDAAPLDAGRKLLSRIGHRTYFLFVLAVSIEVGSGLLEMPTRTATWMNRIFIVVAILQIGVWGTVVAQFLLERMFDPTRPRDEERSTTGILQLLANIVVWSVVLLLGLQNLGINVSAVLAGLGVGGIAIALATQTLLGDIIASISLLFDEPFKPGDFVVVGQNAGTVQKVGIRTTRVKALSGELLVLSNNDLLKSRIQNFKLLEERRILFHFGVTYDTPTQKLRQIPDWVKSIIEGVEKTRFDRCHFSMFGESDLRFETVYFVLDPDYNVYMNVQHAINLGICEKLETEGVSFAFPTRTVHHVGASPSS